MSYTANIGMYVYMYKYTHTPAYTHVVQTSHIMYIHCSYTSLLYEKILTGATDHVLASVND